MAGDDLLADLGRLRDGRGGRTEGGPVGRGVVQRRLRQLRLYIGVYNVSSIYDVMHRKKKETFLILPLSPGSMDEQRESICNGL